MAKYYYSIQTDSLWMSASGNAILTFFNKPGSGKKVNIHNIEIANNSRFGFINNGTVNTNSPAPTRIRVAKVNNVYDGIPLTPLPMNSLATWPSAITVSTMAAYIPNYTMYGPWFPTAAVTMPGTVTPTVSPAWVANELRDSNKYFIATATSASTVTCVGATTNGSAILQNVDNFNQIKLGAAITGTNIPSSSFIIAYDAIKKTVTINQNCTNTGTGITFTITAYNNNVCYGTTSNTSTSITNISGMNDIFIGSPIYGTNIPSGTYITAVNATAKSVTISNAATGSGTVQLQTGKVYKILSNSATAITGLDPYLVANATTTGYVADMNCIAMTSKTKGLTTALVGTTASSALPMPVVNYGFLSGKATVPGGIFENSTNINVQEIYIRAGEALAVFSDFPNCSYPMFVSVNLFIEGTPNRSFVIDYYTYFKTDSNAILAINNPAGSGYVVRIESIDISEVGNLDTCYLQVVPIGSIDPATLTDGVRTLNSDVLKNDSASPDLSSNILGIYTNTYITPYGVPASYISEGSPGNARNLSGGIPSYYNYLNSKDYLGPVYMTIFPEAATWKPKNQTGMNIPSTPGTLNSNVSQPLGSVKGKNAPIVLRENEGFAIVSGAETAASTSLNCVGISGWEGMSFNVLFSVEDARYPTIELQNVYANSRWRMETVPSVSGLGDNGTILVNATADGSNFIAPNGQTVIYTNNGDGTYNISYQYTGSTPQPIRIRVRRASTGLGSVKYLPFEAVFTLTSSDQAIPVNQLVDSVIS